MKKIGFYAATLLKNHNGGKTQVLLNLLRGFEKNGLAERFVIFCIPGMEENIFNLIPNAAAVAPVPVKKIREKTIAELLFKTAMHKYIEQYKIGSLLFPAGNTGFHRYPVPTVVVPHDIQSQTNKEIFSFKARMADALYYHFDFKLRDRIVAVSDFDRQEIIKAYPAYREKIIRIYNPVYTDLLISGGMHKGKNPYITAVNIQYLHKNTITLIKAFEIIRDIIPHDLYLIGRITPGRVWLTDYVREHGLDNRIFFKGFLDDAALAEMIKGSALYVNPSLFEGFGMTTVEAMMAGVPALASSVTAVPEVTMGLCNYYEPPEDETALAEAMKKILLEEKYHDADKLKIISGEIYDRYNYVKISRRYFDLMTSLMTGED